MRRGDIHWAEIGGPAGRRPVVIVTRSSAIPVRTNVTVAPVTSTVRGMTFEVRLGAREGLRGPCAADCDDLATLPKRVIGARIGRLGPRKLATLDRALRFALGIRS